MTMYTVTDMRMAVGRLRDVAYDMIVAARCNGTCPGVRALSDWYNASYELEGLLTQLGITVSLGNGTNHYANIGRCIQYHSGICHSPRALLPAHDRRTACTTCTT
jgi:hypothetical protein